LLNVVALAHALGVKPMELMAADSLTRYAELTGFSLLTEGSAVSITPDEQGYRNKSGAPWEQPRTDIIVGNNRLICPLLTSGEKFEIRLGSQRIHRTLLSWFNSGAREAAARTSGWTTAEWATAAFGSTNVSGLPFLPASFWKRNDMNHYR
jgi:hypothetical protein